MFSDDYDVLIIGGGNAALCAAITAARAAARVLVVEAAPKFYRGGNSRHTRNLRCAHDHGNAVLTGPYPEEEFLDDLMRVTDGRSDEELARLTISESKQLWDFMTAEGVRFQPSLTGTLALGRTNAFFLGGGRALLNTLYASAESLGVQVAYDAEVIGLDIDAERFQAARILRDKEVAIVGARTVVLAAGGFEANIEWLKEGWGEAADNFLVRGTPYNRGRVLRLLLDHGIQSVGDVTQCHAVAIDARAPKFDGGIATRVDCVMFGIVVNRNGRRFYDEGEDFWPKRYAVWGRFVAQQPGQIAYAIIDAKSAGLFMPCVFPPIVADTLPALASQLEVNAENLQHTIKQFNSAVRLGNFDRTVLDDCRTDGLEPEKTHWARRIDTPPYSAYPLRPGITFTYLGVRVDRQARVILEDGTPTQNMFAAGEIMAGNVLGQGYLAGIGMTIGSVFGRIAGREAASHVGY